jgi:drug/metabolite transporter (DMT)-like permease
MLMLLATALVATSFPVGAAITEALDARVLTLLRFVLAAILFAPFVAWRYTVRVPAPRDLARYAILSACLVAFFWGMFAALRLTSALNTAAIFALTPVITALLSAVLLKERLPAAARLALPFGALGAVWIVFRGDLGALSGIDLGWGDGLFLAATAMLSVYGTLIKYLHRGEPMPVMTFWTLVTGSAWLLVLSLPVLPSVEWAAVPLQVYAGIAYLAAFTTLVTFFIFQWSTAIIGPTKVMSYTYLNPAFVLAFALVLGATAPGALTYLGVPLIVLATWIVNRSCTVPTALTPGRENYESK